MLKKIALFSALAAMMGTAYAYKAEVGLSYGHYDDDYSYNDGYYFEKGNENRSFAIDATYYLNPVDVKNYPLNEAAFLSRASNFNAQIGRGKNEDSWGYRGDWTYQYENKVTTYQLGLEYFVPNSKFYVNANIGQAKNEYSRKEYYDGDLEDVYGPDKYSNSFYSAEVGYSPINGLLIAAGLTGETYDYDDTVIDPTLRAKYVTTVGKFDANFEADARFGYDTYYNLGADLYIDKTLSVGLTYSGSDDSYSDDYFAIRAKKFFTPQISVEASANINGDVDGYGLRAAYRF